MQSMPMGVLKSWWQPNTHLTQAFANNLSFKIHLVNLAKVQEQLQRLQETVARSIKKK